MPVADRVAIFVRLAALCPDHLHQACPKDLARRLHKLSSTFSKLCAWLVPGSELLHATAWPQFNKCTCCLGSCLHSIKISVIPCQGC